MCQKMCCKPLPVASRGEIKNQKSTLLRVWGSYFGTPNQYTNRFWKCFSTRTSTGQQNPEECYMNRFKKHIACIYGNKLVYVDDNFKKPLGFTWVKMLFTGLLILWLKKLNTVLILLKNNLTTNLWWLKKTMKISKTLKILDLR